MSDRAFLLEVIGCTLAQDWKGPKIMLLKKKKLRPGSIPNAFGMCIRSLIIPRQDEK